MPSWETDRPQLCLGTDIDGCRNCALVSFEEWWDLRRTVELVRRSVGEILHRLIVVGAFSPSLSVETP